MRLPKHVAVVIAVAALPQLAGAQGFDPSSSSRQLSGQSSQVASGVTLIILIGGAIGGAGGAITTTVNRNEKKAADAAATPPPLPAPAPGAPEPFVPAPFPEPLPPAPPTPSDPPPPGVLRAPGVTLDSMLAARAWLRANDVQLKQDLALGAGPALVDLAALAGIAPARRALFAQVLRRNRALLITPRDPTPPQAAAMMSRVGELVWADPQLRVDAEAALAAL